ncbi:MAG: DUF3048 domain-containing protein [Patescibacteria group bacterium]
MVDDFLPPKQPRSDFHKKIVRDEDEEVVFLPPEKVEDEEDVIDMSKISQKSEVQESKVDAKKPVKSRFPKLQIKNPFPPLITWWKARSKKEKIIIAVIGTLVLALLIFGGIKLLSKNKTPPPAPVVVEKTEEVKEPPKPTTVASDLTGVQVPLEFNELPVTGIMIENSPDARPQAGLKDAGVVFEAVAEGGITRFLALYQEAQPDYVGPVRSVRPYYLQWLQGFDAAIGHVGGSGEALAKIRNEGIKDLDQSFNGGAYQRISQRYAPHNVYTSLGSLIALGRTKGYNKSNFKGFLRKVETPPTALGASKIDFAISGPLYNAHFDYVAATNSYNRSQAGAGHIDERSKQQINPKVVIALVMPKGINPDGVHTSYGTIGKGTAFIFQDGSVTVGVWEKSSDKEQFKFSDANGAPLGLNPGQTWLTALGDNGSVTSSP